MIRRGLSALGRRVRLLRNAARSAMTRAWFLTAYEGNLWGRDVSIGRGSSVHVADGGKVVLADSVALADHARLFASGGALSIGARTFIGCGSMIVAPRRHHHRRGRTDCRVRHHSGPGSPGHTWRGDSPEWFRYRTSKHRQQRLDWCKGDRNQGCSHWRQCGGRSRSSRHPRHSCQFSCRGRSGASGPDDRGRRLKGESRPRIDILLPNLGGGGAERVCLDLGRCFASSGHEVRFVLARARGELVEEAAGFADIHDLAAPRARHVPIALWRYVRRERPEAMLVAMWTLTSTAPLVVGLSGSKCRVVVSEHGILSDQYRPRGALHRMFLRLSTAIGYRMASAAVGVSKGVAADMAALSGVSADGIEVIHNPVRQHVPQPPEAIAAAEALWNCRPGKRILSVGRFKEVKNHALMLEAFARLPETARLMLLGDGDLEEDLRQHAIALGIADRVIFAGFHPEPAPFYASADLFVLSSNAEGFGNVIVEALSAGTPVVSTDCPTGPREILDGGTYGAMVPVGDAAALGQAMLQSFTKKPDPATLKARAAQFAPDIAAQRYLELLVSGRSSA